jgi:hypothetical protein
MAKDGVSELRRIAASLTPSLISVCGCVHNHTCSLGAYTYTQRTPKGSPPVHPYTHKHAHTHTPTHARAQGGMVSTWCSQWYARGRRTMSVLAGTSIVGMRCRHPSSEIYNVCVCVCVCV